MTSPATPQPERLAPPSADGPASAASRLTPNGVAALPPRAGAPVDALVPLTMLEAVRALDLPAADLDTELVHELRNKRLGLSETVYQQIKRYQDAAKRGAAVPFDEVFALMRLVGRRPDADICFREAGRRLARAALRGASAPSRLLPGPVARPLALRRVRALASRYLHARVERQGNSLLMTASSPVTADAAPESIGCGHTDAAFGEMLLVLTGQDAVVSHVACLSRGQDACQWRTDWRR